MKTNKTHQLVFDSKFRTEIIPSAVNPSGELSHWKLANTLKQRNSSGKINIKKVRI